jgi:hypothetical protein
VRTKVTGALQALRDADPARTFDPSTAPWIEPNLTDGVSNVEKSHPHPDFESGTRTSLTRRWMLPALAAVTVAAVVGVTVTVTTGRSSGPAHSVFGPESPTPSDPNYAATLDRLRQILATAPTLSDQRSSDTAPQPELVGSPTSLKGANLVWRTTWATAGPSVPAAVQYLRSHRPDWAQSFSLSQTTPSNPVTDLMFIGSSTTVYDQPTLDISIVDNGGGVALRIAAGAFWLPSRDQQKIVGATSATVTLIRPPLANLVRKLTGAHLDSLVALFNGLPIATPGTPQECGLITSEQFYDEISVNSSSGRFVIREHLLNACSVLTVTVNGANSRTLAGDLNAEILKSLGLPARYGGY